jgi:ABC-type nitrate/sulfonate/bicarbonate transport system substrate-binding protein
MAGQARLRGLVGVSAALAMVLTGAACGQPPGGTGGGSAASAAEICPAPDTSGAVKIAMSQPLPVFAPVLLAHATGAFKKAGLDVSVEKIPTADAMPLVGQGKIDGQLTSYASANFNVVEAGVDLRFIAPLDKQVANPPGTPIPGFWARKDVVGQAGRLDLTKIRGGLVVSPTGTRGASALILRDALAPFGMNLGDVRTGQVMSGSDGLVALSTGAVQLAWLSAPVEVQAAKNPDLVPVAGYAPGVTGTTLLAGPGLLNRPQVAVKMMQVLSDVTKRYLAGDYRQNPETVALLAKAEGVSESVIRESTPLSFDPTYSLDGVDEYLTRLQTFLKDSGELEYSDPLPVDKVVDRRFVEALATCARPTA